MRPVARDGERRGPLVSFKTMAEPGENSVMVPPPVVVVVVVVEVVSLVWAHAIGAAEANTILSNSFFIDNPFMV